MKINTFFYKIKYILNDENNERLYKIRCFFYSDWYFILLFLTSIVSWSIQRPYISFVVISVLSSIMLLCLDDVTPGISMVLFAMTSISSNDISSQLLYIPIFIPTIICLIIHVFIFKCKKQFGSMFFPQLVISFAMLIGGCNVISLQRYVGALGYSLFLGFGLLLMYFVFNQYSKKNIFANVIDYFAKSLMFFGLVICFEIIIYYIRLDLPIIEWVKNRVDVGWSISTNLSMDLLLTMPMCFYLASKNNNKFIYILIGLFQYLANIFTISRGGILFGLLILVVCFLYLVFISNSKKQIFISISIVIAIFILVYAIRYKEFNDLINTLISRGYDSRNRFRLYNEAWNGFLSNPFFGVGMGYDGPYYKKDVIQFYWFHSTLFQVIGSMGVVGIISFFYFYTIRYKEVFKYIKIEKKYIFVFLSMLGFEMYSMIDTGTFIPVPCMLLMLFINMVLETQNKDLDLIYKRIV